MKVVIIVVLVIVVGVLIYFGLRSNNNKTSTSTTSPTATTSPTSTNPSAISIVNMSFQPSTLTVKVGTQVTWTNNDSLTHTVTSDTSAFTSGNITPGSTYQHVFDTAGTFPYHCSIHPSMTATIVVQ